jgi:hypothetical protein
MKLITLEDMGGMFGWRGHAAYFNSQQYGFPEYKELDESGRKLYDYNEIYYWDNNRPLKPLYDSNGDMSDFKSVI